LAVMGQDMAQRLAQLLRQREVLREQVQLIAEALAGIGDQIELLRAEARASGVVPGENTE
jgi:lipase chaperone LimK